MSDGNTHRLVGAGTGAVVAGFRAKQQKDHHWWGEVACGALGGYVGGQLHDLLEPAISSWHRDVAHSCTAGGAILAMGECARSVRGSLPRKRGEVQGDSYETTG